MISRHLCAQSVKNVGIITLRLSFGPGYSLSDRGNCAFRTFGVQPFDRLIEGRFLYLSTIFLFTCRKYAIPNTNCCRSYCSFFKQTYSNWFAVNFCMRSAANIFCYLPQLACLFLTLFNRSCFFPRKIEPHMNGYIICNYGMLKE